MAQSPGQGILSAARGFARLSIPQKLGLLAAVAAMVALVTVAVMWARVPEYRVLYSNLSDRDGGEVIAALAQMNVPYRVAEGGTVLMVPADQVYDLRLRLASQGLPKGGAVGFELMDAQKFGISQFAEQVNYQRALAGELARSIQSVGAVQSARVHLAIPRPTVFVREQQKPSASVFVSMYPGRMLDPAQVSAIQHLIASSVPELGARNVTVVDQAGNLLSAAGAAAEASTQLDASQLKYVHAVESSFAQRIENILEPLVGPGNVRAQVTAALDFTRVEETSESFKPNPTPAESSVRSQQTMESISTQAQAAQGVPGALSNQPPGAATAPLTAPGQPPAQAGAAPPPQPTSSQRETITNFEVDKVIRHSQGEVGALRRLAAAVVVNYKREIGADGAVSYKPLTDAEIQQINALVRQAMGFNQERGDTVNVVNAPFSAEVMPGGEAAPSPWGTFVQDLTTPAGVTQILKYLGAALVVLIVLRVARSALRDLGRGARVEPTVEGLPGPGGPGMQPHLAGAGPGGGMVPLQDEATASYEADLRAVKELARQEPRLVANVVKEWVGRGE
ncbi:MAG: flagellar M-ring protein FliF [Burkholderiales bacterium]|nr:flagellar M-ring protein FliF [Burkholderiales bacterium]